MPIPLPPHHGTAVMRLVATDLVRPAAIVLILLGAVLLLTPARAGAAEIAGQPATTTASSRPTLSDLFGDEVIARGKGVEIKRSHLEQALTLSRANLAAAGRAVPEDRRLLQENQVLLRMIVTRILTNRATAADIKSATESMEKKLKEAKDQAVSEETFYRQLKAVGLSPETHRRLVLEESLAQAVVQRELAGNIQIADAQVKDLYANGTDLLVKLMEQDLEQSQRESPPDPIKTARMKDQIAQVRKANLARLEQPERVRISHIFMVTRDRKTDEPLSEEQKKFKRLQLERIRKRALEGEDFSKLVMEYSEDRGLKETKGEYTFSRTERFAPESPEFKAAAFSLEPGKISDIVTTSGGMHVVKLLERIPAKKVEFEKIAPELKEILVQQEVQRAIPDFFARLNKEAQIEMLDPKYRLATATATVGDMEPPKKP